jgi:DNA segregation ATPase FtsK/SpoIIIE-like protein
LLFISPSYKYPIRIQAPFISTEDTENIILELKDKYLNKLQAEEDIYDKELMDILN